MDTVIRVSPRASQAEEWSLALTAMGIAHRVTRADGTGWAVLVAGEEAERARQTLDGLDEDQPREAPRAEIPDPPMSWTAGLYVGLFLLGAFAITGRPGPGAVWFEGGAAAAGRMLGGEPWRAVTALTLHLDAAHVAGNAVALAALVAAIGQRLGPGFALALVLLAGTVGNLLAAVAHSPGHLAVGASTAGFGAIGSLTALRLLPRGGASPRRWRAWTVPVAGLLLLTLLGAGRDSDVLAHGLGLLSGAGCALVAALVPRRPGPRAQVVLGLLAVLTVAAAWWLALRGVSG
jgi:membrane associated rhomboid family serine protease